MHTSILSFSMHKKTQDYSLFCFSFAMTYNLDMFCPLLSCVFYMTDECLEALRVVRGILPNLRCGVSVKILHALSPLLATVGLDMRLCICDIYDGLSSHESSMSSLVIIALSVMSFPLCQFCHNTCSFFTVSILIIGSFYRLG